VSGRLAAFQDAFAQALLTPEADGGRGSPVAALLAQPGFAIYRNTVLKGCIDALAANYPAVARLVGEEWFRAAAAVFAREQLPAQPVLLDYGEGFADFLRQFGPAAELTYLADVARLDRFWSEAHVAADAEPLDPAALASLPPSRMSAFRLRPHPAARWRGFDAPIYTIWSRSRNGDGTIGEVDWSSEGALLTRPFDDLRHGPFSAAGVAFLDACAGGLSVEGAVHAALDVDAEADLAALIRQLCDAGALAALEPLLSEE